MKKTAVLLAIVVVVAGGATYYKMYASADSSTGFRTVEVMRGDLISTISATGTVEPEELVDIGAQIVGRIKKLGIDPNDPEKKKEIDFGSEVYEGMVLANIDESVYKAQTNQAEASYLRAKADLKQLEAKLLQTGQDRKRADDLRSIKDIPGTNRPIKGIADSDYDLAVANHEIAKANVEVGKVTVKQAESALELAQTNLGYTIIKSPIDGVILARRVNVGQTVVANLNVASLFLIAKDLRRMEVWVQVNEADIGQIKLGMPAKFTVNAFPKKEFHGEVTQIRLNAQMTQNVVTYTVVVTTDNSDLMLLPYLTATIQFEIEHRHDVLLVPNGTLRWRPKPEHVAPDVRKAYARMTAERNDGDNQSRPGAPSNERIGRPARENEDKPRLWIKDGDYVQPVEVEVGVTDGLQTEVSGSELKEGMEVVLGESYAGYEEETTNPFAPRIFRRRR